jgi:hypothetical protein
LVGRAALALVSIEGKATSFANNRLAPKKIVIATWIGWMLGALGGRQLMFKQP